MIGRTMFSFAQGPAQESQATRQESSADHRFAAGAAFGGIAEVKLGELAQDTILMWRQRAAPEGDSPCKSVKS
jgi:hypothetical protein